MISLMEPIMILVPLWHYCFKCLNFSFLLDNLDVDLRILRVEHSEQMELIFFFLLVCKIYIEFF